MRQHGSTSVCIFIRFGQNDSTLKRLHLVLFHESRNCFFLFLYTFLKSLNYSVLRFREKISQFSSIRYSLVQFSVPLYDYFHKMKHNKGALAFKPFRHRNFHAMDSKANANLARALVNRGTDGGQYVNRQTSSSHRVFRILFDIYRVSTFHPWTGSPDRSPDKEKSQGKSVPGHDSLKTVAQPLALERRAMQVRRHLFVPELETTCQRTFT